MGRSDKRCSDIEQVPGKRKDKNSFWIEDHFYVTDKIIGGTVYLRCTHYRQKNVRCRNRGKLVDGTYIQTSLAEHTCGDTKNALKIRKLKTRMKEESESLGRNLYTIYKDVIRGEPTEITDELNYLQIRPAMYHARRKKWPSWVKTVDDIIGYYEEGGAPDDDFAQKYYLGFVQYTDEGKQSKFLIVLFIVIVMLLDTFMFVVLTKLYEKSRFVQ